MKKIQKVGSKVFNSFNEADSFCDAREDEGFEHVSMLTNTPAAGEYTVNWGRYVESDKNPLFEDFGKLSAAIDAREASAANEFTADCETVGRRAAAELLAKEAGMSEEDAEYFIAGFCGAHAKQANPRAAGKESVFRAGRDAWGSKEGRRLFRVESVKARSTVSAVAHFPMNTGSGLIANSEYDC